MKKSMILSLVAGATVFAIAGCGEQKSGSRAESLSADGQPLAPQEAAQRDPNDPVVIKINGKPSVSKEEFLYFAQQAMKANPYLANFGITSYENAPAPIKEQLFEAMVQQKLIAEWARDNGVTNTPEYQKNFAITVEQLKQALMAQKFEETILSGITVTDAELTAEFSKDRERFIKEHGSVTIVGAPCKTDSQADEMFRLVAVTQQASFNDAAASIGVEVKEFGKISTDPRLAAGSEVPMAVRRTAMDLTEGSYFGKALDGDTHWVLQVVDREAPVYLTLDEIKPQLQELIKNNKFREVRESRLKELRDSFTVDIDKSSLGIDGPDPLAELQAAMAAEAQQDERAPTTSA